MSRTVLKYPGAKWSIADWIISNMPPHKSYLEPFFGSGAVFFRKPPARIETVNDLDGEIVNLFTCIRDRPGELERAVALTPYSREEYERAWAVLSAGKMEVKKGPPRKAESFVGRGRTNGAERISGESRMERNIVCSDDVERARLMLVRYWQTHGSCARYKSGWKNDVAAREYAYAAQYWARLPAWVAGTVERLKGVQIECAPAVEVIRRFRSPDVLIYADPPYLLSTRKGPQYRVELEDMDHVELLKVLREHPGPVMLSGYDNELYDGMLDGWDKLQRPTQCEKGGRRVETLWVNFQIQTTIGGV